MPFWRTVRQSRFPGACQEMLSFMQKSKTCLRTASDNFGVLRLHLDFPNKPKL